MHGISPIRRLLRLPEFKHHFATEIPYTRSQQKAMNTRLFSDVDFQVYL
jgi:hypothetical protein